MASHDTGDWQPRAISARHPLYLGVRPFDSTRAPCVYYVDRSPEDVCFREGICVILRFTRRYCWWARIYDGEKDIPGCLFVIDFTLGDFLIFIFRIWSHLQWHERIFRLKTPENSKPEDPQVMMMMSPEMVEFLGPAVKPVPEGFGKQSNTSRLNMK